MNFKSDFSSYINLLLAMTENEVKARYKNAVLGFSWTILNPLFQMLIIGFVFQNFIETPVPNYFLFIFPGLLAWNFFSYSLTKATPSIVWERNLIQKANFPREVIPLSIVISNFFHFLISVFLITIFLKVLSLLSIINFQFSIFILVASLIWLLFFTCGFSLLTSALDVKYRDINFFIQALVILWFYATPVIYSLQILPESYLTIFNLNPLTYPFEMFRNSFMFIPLPKLSIFWSNIILSVILVVFGIIIFKKESKTFSDWL